MGDNKHDGSQLKESQKYTFIAIGIVMTFVCASALVLFAKGTDMTDLYAAFSGILGGLIGGLITLEGVRRTVYAQMDIESLKLIPNKVVHLHKLKREIKSLEAIKEEIEFQRSELNHYVDLDRNLSSDEMARYLIELIEPYKKIMDFTSKSFEEKEEELIKIVAEIDLKMYYKVSQIFEELNEGLKMVRKAVQSADILISFSINGKRVMKSAVTVYEDCIRDNNGNRDGEQTFVLSMRGGNIHSGKIVDEILKAVPQLEAVRECLDKRIEELKAMGKQRLNEYKKLDRTML